MIEDIREELQERWRSGEAPQVDGVLFDTGEMILMNCVTVTNTSTRQLEVMVSPLARSSLRAVLEFNRDPWVLITPLCNFEWTERNQRLVCGEGSMGNEGFVASCDVSDGRLRWVAFFTQSNPFLKVETVDGVIVATTSHDHKWRFPPEHPEWVRVGA